MKPGFKKKDFTTPCGLKKNQKIAIIAPAGRVKKGELDTSLQWLRDIGYQPILGENLYNDYYLGYHYAGEASQRLADLQWAISDPEISAIWCARGGYGSIQLIDQLDISPLYKNPKWLCGYSDITVLHNFFQSHGLVSLHTITTKPLETLSSYSKQTLSSFEKVLTGKPLAYDLPPDSRNEIGKAKGKLVGGNLSMLCSIVGTPYLASAENHILFIEDWNENWYALDRMLMCLIKSGYVDKIKGLVIGSFTKMDDKNENKEYNSSFDSTAYNIIQDKFSHLSIPKVFNFPSGHILDNRCLILGAEVKLVSTEKKVRLKFQY